MNGQDNKFENVEIFSPGSAAPEVNSPVDLMAQGKAISRVQTQYHTAVAVQRPRNLDLIIKALDKEAQYGGESFFYSWPVMDKRTGKKTIVEGCSIGASMAIAREFGNCAIPIDVQETSDSFIFTSSFVDIEKGFTISRVYRHKKKPVVGRYDSDRWEDMEFQKGQSKAIRNVVLAGVPKWLSERMLRKAREAVIAGIGKEGLDVARDKVVKFLAGKGVSLDRIEAVVDKVLSEWTADDVASLRGICSQVHDGQASADSFFPEIKQEEKKEEKPDPKRTEKKQAAQPPKGRQITTTEEKKNEPAKKMDTAQRDAPEATDKDKAIRSFFEEIDYCNTSQGVDEWRAKHHGRVEKTLHDDNDQMQVFAYADDRYAMLTEQEGSRKKS
ncbi:MAG: hypothetical protein SCH71_16990 [Desulfobulbaceae bacterium]|nr:hypothetical protein [Desulfobulbaceae bacterium]